MHSGRYLIFCILFLALAMAGFSWYFRYLATDEAARFWSPVAATTIRDAQQVEALWIHEKLETEPSTDTLTLSGTAYKISRRVPIGTAKGLTHLRYALLVDQSYSWHSKDQNPLWSYALQFDPSGPAPVTVFLSHTFEQLGFQGPSGSFHSVNCSPIAAGLRTIFAEWETSPPPR